MIERPRLDHLTLDADVYGKSLFLHYADLDDITTIRRILMKVQPDELYHFAGQNHVGGVGCEAGVQGVGVQVGQVGHRLCAEVLALLASPVGVQPL